MVFFRYAFLFLDSKWTLDHFKIVVILKSHVWLTIEFENAEIILHLEEYLIEATT